MTITKENICEYVSTRKELLLTKLKKKITNEELHKTRGALRELETILKEFCK